MQKKRIELDVDHIGTQPSKLTIDEENMISDYIRAQKAKKMKQRKAKDKVDA